MFDESNLIVGLEIGTSKVCAIVGEVGPEGGLNIVAVGQSPAKGVRKGEIVDQPAAEEAVRDAIVEAEHMANIEIRDVYLGVTGAHIRGFNNRGVHRLYTSGRVITPEDVEDVVKNAKAINVSAPNSILHAVRQHFYLDGQNGVLNPVGMEGALLEVDVHVIHGVTNRMHNGMRLLKNLHLEVNEIIFNGLATSLALLTNEQKEQGALVIDMGGGTTEYVVYANGIIKHTGVFAIGGEHVSNDLSHGLKVPPSRAEKLKKEFGAAIVADDIKGQTVPLPNELNLPVRQINLEHLQRIMSLRLEEIFQIILHDLQQNNLEGYIANGVHLCGGCARIPRIAELAQSVFEAPATIGQTNSVSGVKSALNQPEFHTAVGLVKYGSLKNRRRPAPMFSNFNLKGILDKFLPLH